MNQKQIRKMFKEHCPEYRTSKKHNEQKTDVRCEFSTFVDQLRRDNLITEKMASKVTM